LPPTWHHPTQSRRKTHLRGRTAGGVLDKRPRPAALPHQQKVIDMKKQGNNAVWRFTRHGGQTKLGFGTESEAISHCRAISAGILNPWSVERVDDVDRAKFKALVASGAIFDIAERAHQDGERHAENHRATRKLMHFGNEA
jgi:hypothetical protein